MRSWIIGVLLAVIVGSLSACASNQTRQDYNAAAGQRGCSPYSYYPYSSYCGARLYGDRGYYYPYGYGYPNGFYPRTYFVYAAPVYRGHHGHHGHH